MIEVTRLNGNPMIVNSELIKLAEASPDTMLTLIHGEKLIVRESCAEILEKVIAYRVRLLASVAAQSAGPADLPRLLALAGHTAEATTRAAISRGGPTLLSTDGKAAKSGEGRKPDAEPAPGLSGELR